MHTCHCNEWFPNAQNVELVLAVVVWLLFSGRRIVGHTLGRTGSHI